MKVKNLPLSHFVRLLQQREPFCYARYGDGEWLTILGGPYIGMRNSNGCTFTQELSDDLNRVLKRQHPYHHAILGIAKRKKGEEIQDHLSRLAPRMKWYNGDLLLDASLDGDLYPLIEELRIKTILYIGNERLRGLNAKGKGFFEYQSYIQPPPQNSHLFKSQILSQAARIIRQQGIEVVGWSAGLASKVFIDEIYAEFPHITQIDFGSMFDGYFEPLPHIQEMGRNGSRSYIRKGGHDWGTLLKQNTEGKKSVE